MKYYSLVLIMSIFSCLYGLKVDDPAKLKKNKHLNESKIQARSIKDNYDFDLDADNQKKNNRSPELQKLIDELKNDLMKEMDILRKNHQNEKKSLKEKFKLERKKIIMQFRKNRKLEKIKKF
mgnify:CR=1 FL=1